MISFSLLVYESKTLTIGTNFPSALPYLLYQFWKGLAPSVEVPDCNAMFKA